MSLQIKPVQATTYTLTATNQVGSDSVSVTITLVPVTSTGPQSGNTAVLYLASSESGSLVKNAAAYSKSPAVCAGDNAQNLASRAFLSYDITSIPPSAIIQGAELDFGAYALSGNPTYSSAMWGNMGALEVYRSQYGKYEDPGRIAYEFPAPPLGSLRLTGDISSRLKLDVTVDGDGVNVIQQLMADGQSRCQFRVQFFTSTNWDGKADLICLDEATLIVKYSVP
jgi:PKD repeat protein